MEENNEKMEQAENTAETKKEKREETKKKGKGGAGCLVFLLILLLTPILVAVGMYFLNHDFELYSNRILSQLPGGFGEHFALKPTRADELRTVKEAADFLIKLENSRIVDKLKLIRSKDERFYDDLIKELLRLNPNKIRFVLEEMRRTGEEKDLLTEIRGDVEKEKEEEIKAYALYLTELILEDAVLEVSRLCEEYGGHERAAKYFEIMDDKSAYRILYLLNNEDRNQIFALLTEAKAKSIKAAYKAEQRKNQEIEQLAALLKREKGSVIAAELRKFPQEDQVLLLKKLGPRVSGLALSHFEDYDMALNLVTLLKRGEIAEHGKDEVTADLLKALKVYKEFDDNVKELIDVYGKMETGKVVQIVKDMMINPAPERSYRLTNGDSIDFTDLDLITEIFRGFPEKKVAEILSKLDDILVSEITRRLALPR